MTRIKKQVSYCQVHNRFRTVNGRWLNAGCEKTELNQHVMFLEYQTGGAVIVVDDICDECENPKQTKLELPEYKGTFHVKKG